MLVDTGCARNEKGQKIPRAAASLEASSSALDLPALRSPPLTLSPTVFLCIEIAR